MSDVAIHAGDNRVHLRRLIDAGVRVHSVVTDPPYGLVSARTPDKGFMGRAWDGTGIERDPEFWRLIHDILLPGGYVFAFSGSRTGHWQACAMETAGFIMHPMHGWVQAQGFPKAHDAAKAIDKHRGVEGGEGEVRGRSGSVRNSMSGDFTGGEYRAYLPGSPDAARWEGWAYSTQAQKPALEPIYLGQKPFSEKTGAANILKHGVGAVNIDACRVPTGDEANPSIARRKDAINHLGDRPAAETEAEGRMVSRQPPEAYRAERPGEALGRHPSNLILDGSPEVVALFPQTKSGKPGTPMTGFGDEGSAARFFHHFPPDTDPIIYNPKAGKADRAGSCHPTVKPIALMRYLIRHVTPPGGTVLDPFAGSGTTGEAARLEGFNCVLMEADPEYAAFLQERFEDPDGVIAALV